METNIFMDEKILGKIWLLITGIPGENNQNNIEKYLKTRKESVNLSVNKLNTGSSRKNNQFFRSVLNLTLKNKFTKAGSGQISDRFNFKLGKRFLDNAHHLRTHISNDNSVSERSNSFL